MLSGRILFWGGERLMLKQESLLRTGCVIRLFKASLLEMFEPAVDWTQLGRSGQPFNRSFKSWLTVPLERAKQSKEAAFKGKTEVLDEEIGRMRAQRQRLEHNQGTSSRKPRNARSQATSFVREVGIASILVLALVSLWLYGFGRPPGIARGSTPGQASVHW